jgi:hypothetical protein
MRYMRLFSGFCLFNCASNHSTLVLGCQAFATFASSQL